MRALVTGASGFVGAAMCRAALRASMDVTGVTRATCDYSPQAVASLVDATGADFVFHAAGAASVAGSMSEPGVDFAASVALLESVLEGLRRSTRRPRMVYPSSAAVYGNPKVLPVSEDSPLAPISAYGYHKAMCELLVREYADCFGIPGMIARPFSLFGESQRRLLVWEIFRQYHSGARVELFGTGDEERDYLHVDDFADLAWACAMSTTRPCEVVNLASGVSIRVLDLARRVGDALGSGKPVSCKGQPSAGDPAVWRADVGRLRELCPKVSLPDFDGRLGQVLGDWSR